MADKEPAALQTENAKLREELAALKAQHGLPVGAITVSKGQKIHYVRGEEQVCRPATVLSDGVTDRMKAPPGHPMTGNLLEYVHLAYGDHDPQGPKHTFETTRHYHPGAAPDSWHLSESCPRRA